MHWLLVLVALFGIGGSGAKSENLSAPAAVASSTPQPWNPGLHVKDHH